MGQYEVRHQCDKTCANCAYYELFIFEDSFGEKMYEDCFKEHYERVGLRVSACKDFKPMNNSKGR